MHKQEDILKHTVLAAAPRAAFPSAYAFCQFAISRSAPVSRSFLAAAECYETNRDAFPRANS